MSRPTTRALALLELLQSRAQSSGAELARLSGHTKDVEALAFSPDGSRLASGAVHRTVRRWETRGWSERAGVSGHPERVDGRACAPDGTRLGRIETGVPTGNVAWGGDGSVLYVAANHWIARIRTNTRGSIMGHEVTEQR